MAVIIAVAADQQHHFGSHVLGGISDEIMDRLRVEFAVAELAIDILRIHHADIHAMAAMILRQRLDACCEVRVNDHQVLRRTRCDVSGRPRGLKLRRCQAGGC